MRTLILAFILASIWTPSILATVHEMTYLGVYDLITQAGLPEVFSRNWDVYVFPACDRERSVEEGEETRIEIPGGFEEGYLALISDGEYSEWILEFDEDQWRWNGFHGSRPRCLRPVEGAFIIEDLPYQEYVWFPIEVERKFQRFLDPDDSTLEVLLDWDDRGWSTFQLLWIAREDGGHGGHHEEEETNCLIVGEQFDYGSQICDYLTRLGYLPEQRLQFPLQDEDLSQYDFLVAIRNPMQADEALLRDYLSEGGGVFLSGPQPVLLGFPDWIGMESSTLVSSSAVNITAAYDAPFGNPIIKERFTFCYRILPISDATALSEPSTATIDATYYYDQNRAACIHNEYGSGRLAWTTTWYCPQNLGDEGYSTEFYDAYLTDIYWWLSMRP